jgi:sterol desaturase/sphingolipid hydroxylase (fatty acid hydroxylase superfamily)
MEFDLYAAVKYAFPVFIICMIVEYLYARDEFDLKESFAGVQIAIGASLIGTVTLAAKLTVFIIVFEFFKNFRMEYLGFESFGWAWYVWIACLLLDDMCFYWHHRFSHSIRLLWAAHIPHHSAKKFNLTIGIRNGWLITFYKPIWWLWMPLIGFEPVMIATTMTINAVFQFFLHVRHMPSWGWIGQIINNSYIHRAHHACNVEYLDKNHGGIFLFWDKLFGTFVDVDDKIETRFGVLHDPNSYNPIKIHTHEFQDIWRDVKSVDSWSDKLKYIFYPPGWSHDNSSKTSRQLQREMKQAPIAEAA